MKAKGIHTALETCLYVPWEQLEPLLPYVDLFLTDIKHMDSAQHVKLTGAPNELILDNFKKLSQRDVPLRVRIPLLPGMNDSWENLQAVADFIAPCKNVLGVDVLPYNRLGMSKCRHLGGDYALPDVTPPSPDSVKQAASVFEGIFSDVSIGG